MIKIVEDMPNRVNGLAHALDTEQKFRRLCDEWKTQRRHEPSTMKAVLLPAYQ